MVYYKTFYGRKGVHYYDLRLLEQWEGKVDYLVTSLDKNIIRGHGLVESSIKNELDVLLDKEEFTLSTLNLVRLKTFFGYSMTALLFILALFFSIFFYFLKRKIISAIFLSILIVTIIEDNRIMIDHFRIVQQIEEDDLQINPTFFIAPFAEEAKPLINGKWTYLGNLQVEYFKLFLRYEFSDIPFIRESVQPIPKGTFIVTTQKPTGNQKTLLQKGQFYLLEQR